MKTNGLNNETEVTSESTSNVEKKVDNNIVDNQSASQVSQSSQITYNQFGLPEVSSNNNVNDKKKLIIIIGIVVVLISAGIFMVMRGKDSGKSNNRDTIYIYRKSALYSETKVVSYDKLKNKRGVKYRELTSYKCKGSCIFTEYYGTGLHTIIILDDEKLYQYEGVGDTFNELKIDYKLKGEGINFLVWRDYVIAYSNNKLQMEYKEIDFEKARVDSKTRVPKRYLASLESLKDNVYVIVDKAGGTYSVYNGNEKLSEYKLEEINHPKLFYDGGYINIDHVDCNIIMSKSGQVQKNLKKDDYRIYEGKLILRNESGSIEVYEGDNLLNTNNFTDSRVIRMNYVVGIRDGKLLIVDAVTQEVIYDFGKIGKNEAFVADSYDGSITSNDLFSEKVYIFLEDTSKPRENKKSIWKDIFI